jgi:hypothetical protein
MGTGVDQERQDVGRHRPGEPCLAGPSWDTSSRSRTGALVSWMSPWKDILAPGGLTRPWLKQWQRSCGTPGRESTASGKRFGKTCGGGRSSVMAQR